MTRDQVRAALAVPWEAFSRTTGADVSDHFRSIPAFAEYTPDGFLQAVEFARGASVSLGRLDLTGSTLSEAIERLAMLDPDLEREPSGCISKAVGVGLWSEGARDLPAQSVIVFAPGYYD